MKMEDKYLFVEKFRPKTVSDMVLPEKHRIAFNRFINEKNIPHMILCGPPGSGKTTVARIIIDKILADKQHDCMNINGSSETGVGNIRDFVQEYLKVPPSQGSKIKIVFIDEADYLSQNAQAALRHITEKYSDIGRFIFTINYKSKIIEPLFSRLTLFEFKALDKQYIQQHCYKVLDSESIKYEPVFIDKIINMYGSDIRRIVNTIQGMVDENKCIISDESSLINNELKIRSYVNDLCIYTTNRENGKVMATLTNIQNILKETEIDFYSVYLDMFHDDKISPWAKIVINRYSQLHLTCMIPGLNFSAMCYEIVKTGNQLSKLKK